ncbi:PucR family transcriptional regulator [Paenibacillus roseipurpureus]|uniref:PucR family transcriptional regulator ligand-binding domain-containing protein n=1 Tax=Paenibacillus roseopurpureus TaxID=2918901 RepID=A0AA96LMM7_9BACL|nr:PucR family transcriptional regulator ligand-binding domain-containing protein [Paenibacillus sp. MBLB1832]WNR42624.1 PucR family transcriptional regulator ligand-binding domain-containing protein [Paenibacillus sp. MBLB1832]
MSQQFQLTVADVLKRPSFQHAYIAAGHAHLGNHVRWVHIIEVIQFEQLLQGGEMILTTGAAFKDDIDSFMTYFNQLVQRKVSCLCVEMGHYVNAVPQAWKDAAEAQQLPLVIFPEAVRFIDITQDIHATIINQHHQALQDLEKISREFHRMTLTSQGVSHVLSLLHSSTQADVIYVPSDSQPKFVPPMGKREAAQWLTFLESIEREERQDGRGTSPLVVENGKGTVIVQPVGAMGKTWAHLLLVLDRKPQEYEYLILDSASLSIAQDLLRRRYMEERKLYAQTLWVDDLLHMRIHDEEQIKVLLGAEFKRLNALPYHVILIEFKEGMEDSQLGENEGIESAGLHLSLAVRSLFEGQLFHPLITLKHNRLVVVAFDKAPKKPSKERLQHVFHTLHSLHADEHIDLKIGVGQSKTTFLQAHRSYQEALQAMSLAETTGGKKVMFYDELGVFVLLTQISDKEMLASFVRTYVGPLIDHDLQKGSELLRTLKVYLDHDGSKQMAAGQLFIVRQSLYYRLDKIEELLGADYMLPEKRLALQVAIRAYQLLYPEKKL